MRAFIRLIDAILRRAYGVFEFTDDPSCLIRVSIGEARQDYDLGRDILRKGERVLNIHLWNEHAPAIPPEGADLAWGVRTWRLWRNSLRQVAAAMPTDPRLQGVRAVGGVTSVLIIDGREGGVRFMERQGFQVTPFHNRLGRFGDFWDNLYAWALMWAFNPPAARDRPRLNSISRSEFWMSASSFLSRYGPQGAARGETEKELGEPVSEQAQL